MIDYKVYTNGNGKKNVKNDTIALPWYNDNIVTIEIMHPNEFEEPYFPVDGIRKEILVVTDDLKLFLK